MIRVDSRESAHLKSRVKDLSVVPNMVSYNGLFACITPISKLKKNEETGTYEPILIRDVESLIANFGDPRVDPDKYIDLYCIMQLVANGGTCYVAKVDSGSTGEYEFAFVEDPAILTAKVEDDIHKIIYGTEPLNPVWRDIDPTTKSIEAIDELSNKYQVYNLKGRKHTPAVPAVHDHYTEGNTTITAKATGSSGITVTKIESAEPGKYMLQLSIGGTPVYGPVENWNSSTNLWEVAGGAAAYVTISSTSASLASVTDKTLSGWTPAVPESNTVPIEISPEDYEVLPTLSGTAGEVNAWELAVKYTGTDDINQISIENAELDPDYGREAITLTEDTSSEYPASSSKYLKYKTGELDRKYSFIEILDKDASIIPHTEYSVSWESVNGGKFKATITFKTSQQPTVTVSKAARQYKSLYAYSSVSEDLNIYTRLVQLKPLSLGLYYLYVDIYDSSDNHLASGKVKLEETTTNQMIVNVLNSALKDYLSFELVDISTASAAEANNLRDLSIAYTLLNKYAEYDHTGKRNYLPSPDYSVSLDSPVTTSVPDFTVTFDDYVNAINQYKDHKYNGRLLADLTSNITDPADIENPHKLKELNDEDRRSFHYKLKEVACERKDCTVILSTPNNTDIDDVCAWVSSQEDHTDLWEYGETNTDDPALQSFYLEIYYSWLNMSCTRLIDNKASSVTVKVAPSSVVINNILTSWRNKGMWIPVAGDQGGVLPDSCTPIVNPATKLQRDQLVQYRINPIWDTGTRGVQIFGNETLNAGYTDLNAAHIARTLVYIRSTIDEYTETLKFSINSLVLWEKWKTYVASKILEPLVSANALAEYQIEMGEDTTSAAEIANRRINGLVHLRFYQSAEIFNLTYTVYSTSTTIDEARSSM